MMSAGARRRTLSSAPWTSWAPSTRRTCPSRCALCCRLPPRRTRPRCWRTASALCTPRSNARTRLGGGQRPAPPGFTGQRGGALEQGGSGDGRALGARAGCVSPPAQPPETASLHASRRGADTLRSALRTNKTLSTAFFKEIQKLEAAVGGERGGAALHARARHARRCYRATTRRWTCGYC
jgi:hypothetical protein